MINIDYQQCFGQIFVIHQDMAIKHKILPVLHGSTMALELVMLVLDQLALVFFSFKNILDYEMIVI